MKWKIKDNLPKQSISSNNSMSFLTDENLTFKRFSDGTISVSGRQYSDTKNLGNNENNSTTTTITVNSNNNNSNSNKNKSNKKSRPNKNNMNFSPAVWTTNTKMNYPNETTNIEFQYIPTTITTTATTTTSGASITAATTPTNESTKSLHTNNMSTAQLLDADDDRSSKQSKCSVFRGIILCLCLNITYANVVRFPRELERHGIAFLIPYFILLLFIGLPIVLLEISLGQFLGQDSAHTWRASPFFKGASIVGRIASWLGTIWTSLQAVIAFLYIGMLILKSVPFNHCANLRIVENGYATVGTSGQKCLSQTFLTPVWENTLYFGLLTMALIIFWIIIMACTISGKMVRRAIFTLGLLALGLFLFVTGWEVARSITDKYFPEMWPFDEYSLGESTIWFNALVQVIFSTNIGIGAIPVLTGKFLYKGDAVKTSFIYISFNILVSVLAVLFFIMQFNNPFSNNTTAIYEELTTITAIYDHALIESDPLLSRLIPGLAYLAIFITAIISVIIYIYTSSRIIRKHPNQTMCFGAILISVVSLLCPEYIVARLLDSRIVGAFIICALIFDIISVTWIYGAKNIYTDLEFSIGRPIFKIWVAIWAMTPILLTGILIWWAVTYISTELLIDYIPRWLPIVLSLGIVVIMACIEVSKQVDYNFISMIKGATKPSKDWGPADPLVRHAWKQWTTKCEDTGERDFTLRRRGTKDYTNSIKRGQYPHGKYGTHPRNTSTPGSNSPNYSGSVFGDSAIEEDISVDKFSNYPNQQQQLQQQQQLGSSFHQQDKLSIPVRQPNRDSRNHERYRDSIEDRARGSFYQRKSSATDDTNYTSRIEIMPQETPNYKISLVRNPMARVVDTNPNYNGRPSYHDNYDHFKRESYGSNENGDHICWRKYSGNSEEYSTEL